MYDRFYLGLALLHLAACHVEDTDIGDTGASSSAESNTNATEPGTTSAGPGTTEGDLGSTTEVTEESSTSNTSGTTGFGTTDGAEDSEGPADASSCDEAACDPGSQYCYESIIDGPSEFSCPPIPAECRTDPSCACILPRACPGFDPKCSVEDGLVVVRCVDG